MKRFMKKSATLFLSLCMCVITAAPVMAASTTVKPVYEKETYVIRLFPGAKGTIETDGIMKNDTKGTTAAITDGIAYIEASDGDQISLYYQEATVDPNANYYQYGIKRSGLDNSEALASFTAEEDADYVVAYGVKGQQVAYKVRYETASGVELLPEETYYGNVGDSPIIAYRYIEGYRPNSYNLTGTLKADEENIFTFIYRSNQAAGGGGGGGGEVITETTTRYVYLGGGVQVVEGNGEGAAAPVNGQEGGQGAAGENAGAAGGNDQPQDLVNIDEGETPLADRTLDGSSSWLGNLPTAAKAGIISGLALIVIIAGYFLLGRKKKNEEE